MSEEKESVREMLAAIRATQIAEEKNSTQYRIDLNKRLDSYSNRLGSLERWRTMVTGAGAIVTAVGAVLWHKIENKFHIGQ